MVFRLSGTSSKVSVIVTFVVKSTENYERRCSDRVKKAIPESDRMGHYGSGKKGQSEEKGHYYGS